MDYTKSSYPELVDLKITDYCDVGCGFCYQGSTTSGNHANMETIIEIIAMLAGWKVFEVAIGGGEPTEHPKFLEILERFNVNKIVPNFTTKKLDWLDTRITEKIIKNIGSFAYSVDTPEDVLRLDAKLHDMDNLKYEKKPVVHYVMGSSDFENFQKIIDIVTEKYYPITLLGYKTNGRGASFKPMPYREELLNFFRTLKIRQDIPTISIDTKLAQEIAPTLISEKAFDPLLVTMEDGKFSMYIDAVALKFGPSSYCDVNEMSSLKFRGKYIEDQEEVLKVYRSY